MQATRSRHILAWVLCAMVLVGGCSPALAAGASQAGLPWWFRPLALFVVCFLIGVIAVPSGLGGGVLFVPIVGTLFPFNLDFVRGAGLLLALASSLAAAPHLLRLGYADLRLGLPAALIVSITSTAGALLGLAFPPNVIEIALGVTIISIAALMWRAKRSAFPDVPATDAWGAALRIGGIYVDPASDLRGSWRVHRTKLGYTAFAFIGLLAGMFGLGAGWANVPALNLLMGAPLKIALGTSSLILATASSAAWVYLNEGALTPMIAVPAVVGMMLGAFLGARLLAVLPGGVIRRLVIAMLVLTGVRVLLRGLVL
jgi:uncharacterized protein